MNIYAQSRTLANTILIGAWWSDKFRRNAINSGTLMAAKNMRKCGCPIELALLCLARR